MYRRILVAIDFSEPSVDALRWTVERFPGAEVHLFHAVEDARPPEYLRRALGEAVDVTLERELDVRANLDHVAEEVGIEPRILVRRGWPPRAVHRAAKEAGADLVVVGAHTRRILPWDEPGATAAKIVQEATLPVLVWRPAPRQSDAREVTVLAPLDLREGSEPVAVAAGGIARHLGGRLVLLHVLPRPLQAYLRAVSSAAKARETLRRVQRVAREDALSRVPDEWREQLEVQVLVTRGRPTTQILAVAENEAASLIAMGQRHSPIWAGRALLGSVTDAVLRGANCSVLCVPL